jgi:hypothetical protein
MHPPQGLGAHERAVLRLLIDALAALDVVRLDVLLDLGNVALHADLGALTQVDVEDHVEAPLEIAHVRHARRRLLLHILLEVVHGLIEVRLPPRKAWREVLVQERNLGIGANASIHAPYVP